LSNGFSYQLMNIISAIRAKDPDEAARLAGEIMDKLRTAKLDSNVEAHYLAIALLQLAAAPNSNKESVKITTPLLDQPTIRELTEMIAKEALRSPKPNPSTLASLNSVMPVIEKYSPSQAAQLRRKAPPQADEQESNETDDNGEMPVNYRQVLEKGSADDILNAAAKAPPGASDMFYGRAATKLIGEGNAERARQIVNEKIQDPMQRKQMLAQLDQAAAVAAAEQGKIEQARKLLATLRTDEERAKLLAQLANGAGAKGEKKIALQLLDEARGMVGQRAKNARQLSAQLTVAQTYIRLDPKRSFEMFEPIVDQLNELLGAWITMGAFFSEEMVKDDEIMLTALAMYLFMGAGNSSTDYIGDLVALAHADFDRTRALVDRFQRDEVRIMMRLILAQGIFSPPVKGDANGNQPYGILSPSIRTGGVTY